jgi:hypothetical protein
MTEVRGQRSEVRGQMTDDRGQRSEVRGQMTDDRGQRSEVRYLWWVYVLWPLRTVGSPYEPEAIGAYAYDPVVSRKIEP